MHAVAPIVIRAGESIDSALLADEHPMGCGFDEDVRCVRVLVEGSAGEQVDLTLSAVEGQPVDFRDRGLGPLPFPRPSGSVQTVTLPSMGRLELWIAGGPANFTLTATRR
jgi:hypothetical protein